MTNRQLTVRLKALADKYTPTVFYDIGANNPFDRRSGAIGFWRRLFPSADFYLFESAESHLQKLEKSGLPFEICTLGSKDGKTTCFYSHKHDTFATGASCYLENTDFFDPTRTKARKVKTKTLDKVVRERKWPKPDLIKIDTQGSELDILLGAKSCVRSANVIICEVKLQQYNKGAPFAFKIEEHLWKSGFRLIEVLSTSYVNGWAIESDFLFARKDHFLAQAGPFSWRKN